MNPDPKRILLSPLFVLGLCLLLINDFYLKAVFHNTFTGKLSDFAGLFVLSLFLGAFLPRARGWLFIAVGIFFCLWKSAYAQIVIDGWNQWMPVHIGRTVDFTDLVALTVLPFAYIYPRTQSKAVGIRRHRFVRVVVTAVSVFAFTATSAVDDRHVWVDIEYEVPLTRNILVDRLEQLDTVKEVRVEKMSDVWPKDKYPDLNMSPTGFYLRFKLRHSYCESKDIEYFSAFEDKGTSIYIDGFSFRYWCPNEPTADDKEALKRIFEDKVIARLSPEGDK